MMSTVEHRYLDDERQNDMPTAVVVGRTDTTSTLITLVKIAQNRDEDMSEHTQVTIPHQEHHREESTFRNGLINDGVGGIRLI